MLKTRLSELILSSTMPLILGLGVFACSAQQRTETQTLSSGSIQKVEEYGNAVKVNGEMAALAKRLSTGNALLEGSDCQVSVGFDVEKNRVSAAIRTKDGTAVLAAADSPIVLSKEFYGKKYRNSSGIDLSPLQNQEGASFYFRQPTEHSPNSLEVNLFERWDEAKQSEDRAVLSYLETRSGAFALTSAQIGDRECFVSVTPQPSLNPKTLEQLQDRLLSKISFEGSVTDSSGCRVGSIVNQDLTAGVKLTRGNELSLERSLVLSDSLSTQIYQGIMTLVGQDSTYISVDLNAEVPSVIGASMREMRVGEMIDHECGTYLGFNDLANFPDHRATLSPKYTRTVLP